MERTRSYDHALFDGGGLVPPPERLRKVLVVGAGVAGLQTARQLTKMGAQVLVLESNAEVGGVWIRNYIGFGLQVPWRMYQFPEFPWPKHLQPSSEYPTGQEVQEYVRAYCQEYDLRRCIRFNCKLLRLRWCAASRQWDALYCDTCQEKFFKVTVDYAVICAGIYSQPYIPDYEGTDSYAGIQLHAKDFVDLSLARGRRVVIVGAGKTALDCVSSIVATNTATSVTLLYRQAHWPLPRRMLGTSVRRLLFNRAMTAMMPPYYTASRTAAVASKATLPLRSMFWRSMESVISRKFRITEQMRPRVHLPSDLFYGGQILDNTMDKLVRSEALLTIKGEINRFVRNGVILQDGNFVAADLVLYCTGYLKTYDYLEGDMRARLDLQKDGLYLYRNCLPYAVPHLAFIGSEVSTYNNILTHGLQALWLAHVLSGRIPLPSPTAMAEDVRAQQRWRRAVMPAQRSRGSVLMLYMMQYHDQLLADMGRAPHRKGLNLLAECFGTYTAEDYLDLLESDDVVLASRRAEQQLAAAGVPPSVQAAAASGSSGIMLGNAPSPLAPPMVMATALMPGGGGGVTAGELCTSTLLDDRLCRGGSCTRASISVRSCNGQDCPDDDHSTAAAAATSEAVAYPRIGSPQCSRGAASRATSTKRISHVDCDPDSVEGLRMLGQRAASARSIAAAANGGGGSGYGGCGNGCSCGGATTAGCPATHAPAWALSKEHTRSARSVSMRVSADLAMASRWPNGSGDGLSGGGGRGGGGDGDGGCYSGSNALRGSTMSAATKLALASTCTVSLRGGPREPVAADFLDADVRHGARNLLFPAAMRRNSCSATTTLGTVAVSSSGGIATGSGSDGIATGSGSDGIATGSGSDGIAAVAGRHSFSACSPRESAVSAAVPVATLVTGNSASGAATTAQVAVPTVPAGSTARPSSPSRLSRYTGPTSPIPCHSAHGHPTSLLSPTGRGHGEVRSLQAQQQQLAVAFAHPLEQQHILQHQHQQQHLRWSLCSSDEAMAAAAAAEGMTMSGGSGSGGGGSGGGRTTKVGSNSAAATAVTAAITTAAAGDGGGSGGGSGNNSSGLLYDDSSGAVSGTCCPPASWQQQALNQQHRSYQHHHTGPQHQQQHAGGTSVGSRELPPEALALASRADSPMSLKRDRTPMRTLPGSEGLPRQRPDLSEGEERADDGAYGASGDGSSHGLRGDPEGPEQPDVIGLHDCMCGSDSATAAALAGGGRGCVKSRGTTARVATVNGQSLYAAIETGSTANHIRKVCHNGNNNNNTVALSSDRSEVSQSPSSEGSNGSCSGCSGDGTGCEMEAADVVGAGGGTAAAAAAVDVKKVYPIQENENGNATVAVALGSCQTPLPPPLPLPLDFAATPVWHGAISEHRHLACGSLGGGSDAMYGSPGSSAVSLSLWHAHPATGSGGGCALVRQGYGAGARIASPAESRFSAMGRLLELEHGASGSCDEAEQFHGQGQGSDRPVVAAAAVATATAATASVGSTLFRAGSSSSASKASLRCSATSGGTGIYPGVIVGSGGARDLRRTGSLARSAEGTSAVLAERVTSGGGSAWQLFPGALSTGVQSTGSSGGGNFCLSISLAGGLAADGGYSVPLAAPALQTDLVRQPSRLSSCATGDSATGAMLDACLANEAVAEALPTPSPPQAVDGGGGRGAATLGATESPAWTCIAQSVAAQSVAAPEDKSQMSLADKPPFRAPDINFLCQ